MGSGIFVKERWTALINLHLLFRYLPHRFRSKLSINSASIAPGLQSYDELTQIQAVKSNFPLTRNAN